MFAIAYAKAIASDAPQSPSDSCVTTRLTSADLLIPGSPPASTAWPRRRTAAATIQIPSINGCFRSAITSSIMPAQHACREVVARYSLYVPAPTGLKEIR